MLDVSIVPVCGEIRERAGERERKEGLLKGGLEPAKANARLRPSLRPQPRRLGHAIGAPLPP